MNIVHTTARNLASWNRWDELASALARETGFDDIGSRNDATRLRQAYHDGVAVLGVDDASDAPVGFVAAWDAGAGTYEIGSAWVHKEYRQMGHGSRLTASLLQLPRLREVTLFAISQTPDFWRVARRVSLRQHTDWHSPASWEATCGPCTKIADDAKHGCPLRDSACRLFLR